MPTRRSPLVSDPGPTSGTPQAYADAKSTERLAGLAQLFGSTRVQSCGSFGDVELEPNVSARFANTCDQLGPDIQLMLEFQRCTNIGDADLAARIVLEADRMNGGLCVDSWHHFRGANDYAFIKALPAEKIFLIQLTDGPAQPAYDDYIEDTLRSRAAPGDGDWPLADFLRAVWSTGARPPLSIEVMSDAYRQLAPAEIATHLGDRTRILLEATRSTPDLPSMHVDP